MISSVPATGSQPALLEQLGEELGVVDDLVVAAEVGVLVRERVEAVRAARDDLLHAGAVHRGDVLLGVRLERVLVPHPPGRVAGARLARAEHREVDARRLQQLGRRLRRRPRALVEGGGAADPVEHLGRLSPGCSTRTSSPSVQSARSACGLPHGFWERSTSRSIVSPSAGKRPSTMTR